MNFEMFWLKFSRINTKRILKIFHQNLQLLELMLDPPLTLDTSKKTNKKLLA